MRNELLVCYVACYAEQARFYSLFFRGLYGKNNWNAR